MVLPLKTPIFTGSMKIVIASDSFKGCLTSREVAQAAAEGIRRELPDCETVCLAVADGGEGLVEALGGEPVRLRVQDPLGRPVTVPYARVPGKGLAIVETAAASGLPLLRPEERDPMATSSYGTGELVRDAVRQGAGHILLGLGGTATNDAGTGLLEALGFRFLDAAGRPVQGCGAHLHRIVDIQVPQDIPSFSLACDVTAPFCGPQGAAALFAPQKGADADAVRRLDEGLQHFAAVLERVTGISVRDLPGAGAAGGIGGTLHALCGARLARGIDLVLDALDFDRRLEGADLVITGEGRIDRQTVLGKVPAGVAGRARKHGIPAIALCGAFEPAPGLDALGLAAILPVTPPGTPPATALDPAFAADRITRTIAAWIQARRTGPSIKWPETP